MRLALAGQTYSARSLSAAAQTCTNLYPEKIEDPAETAKGGAFMVGCPGRHSFKVLTTVDAAATPLRGLWTGGGRLFVFAGTKYFELNSAAALVGSVRTISNTANYPVQAFGNGNQLLIVSPGQVYVDNGAGPVSINIGAAAGTVDTSGILVTWVSGDYFSQAWGGKAITINAVAYTVDANQPIDATQLYLTSTAGIQTGVAYSQAGEALTGQTGAYLDGYFLVNRPDTRQVNFSAILDGTNWNATDVFVKEGYPDNIRSILACNEQLYVFGTETLQVYQNAGDLTTPFQPIDGTMQRVGSISSWGPIAIDNRVFFVGGSGGGISAYVLDGFTPKRISTYAIEEQWNAAGLGSACVSYAYQEEGHSFWVINFGTQTWCYDTTTGAWHERKIYNNGTGQFTPYLNLYHAYVEWPNGTKQHIVGGGSATIYDSSVNFYDEDGANTRAQRALPHLYNNGKRMFFGPMVLSSEVGTIVRDYSDDQGVTWSTPQSPILQPSGQYKWLSMGSSKDRIPRITITGQTKVGLVCLDLDIDEGEV